jgi:hypothetical protein
MTANNEIFQTSWIEINIELNYIQYYLIDRDRKQELSVNASRFLQEALRVLKTENSSLTEEELEYKSIITESTGKCNNPYNDLVYFIYRIPLYESLVINGYSKNVITLATGVSIAIYDVVNLFSSEYCSSKDFCTEAYLLAYYKDKLLTTFYDIKQDVSIKIPTKHSGYRLEEFITRLTIRYSNVKYTDGIKKREFLEKSKKIYKDKNKNYSNSFIRYIASLSLQLEYSRKIASNLEVILFKILEEFPDLEDQISPIIHLNPNPSIDDPLLVEARMPTDQDLEDQF